MITGSIFQNYFYLEEILCQLLCWDFDKQKKNRQERF